MSQPRPRFISVRRESRSGQTRLPPSSAPQARKAWWRSGCTTDLCSKERTNSPSEINRWNVQHLNFEPTCSTAVCSSWASCSEFALRNKHGEMCNIWTLYRLAQGLCVPVELAAHLYLALAGVGDLGIWGQLWRSPQVGVTVILSTGETQSRWMHPGSGETHSAQLRNNFAEHSAVTVWLVHIRGKLLIKKKWLQYYNRKKAIFLSSAGRTQWICVG